MTYPPPDSADHAEAFAREHAVELDIAAGQVMLDLGIPAWQIGISDPEHGLGHASFHPHGRMGGSVSPDGRINLDSGVLNPALLDAAYGVAAGRAWRATRLVARMEAVAIHEHEEHAVAHAPETELAAGDAARELLRAMARGWKGG